MDKVSLPMDSHTVEVKCGRRGRGRAGLGGAGQRLHLVSGQMMFWEAVGVSHRRVVLVETPDAVHFVVDAAGDVFNVLHVGSRTKTDRHQGQSSICTADGLQPEVWASVSGSSVLKVFLNPQLYSPDEEIP